MIRRLFTRAVPALASAVLMLASARGQGCLPLEQRLQEQWRWRPVSEARHDPTFVSVRPWPQGGLVAVDENGLVTFDGYEWRREKGWEQVRWPLMRDVVVSDEGIVVVAANTIASVDRAGRKLPLWTSANPAQMSNACRLKDGRLVAGVKFSVREVTMKGVDAMFSAPVESRLLAGLGCDASGNLLCVTERGVFKRADDEWLPLPVDRPPSRAVDGMMYSLQSPDGLLFVPKVLDEDTPGYVWDGERVRSFWDPKQVLYIVDATMTPQNELIAAVRDPELRVWRDGRWYTVELPPPVDTVQSLSMLADGRLAVVFSSGRMSICDLASDRWELHDPAPAGAHRRVNALAPSARGGVWLATHEGIVRWDGSGFTDLWRTAGDTGVPLTRLTTICEDARGRVWLGSGSGFAGTLCLDGDRWTWHREEGLFGRYGTAYVHAIRRVGDDVWFTLLGNEADGWGEGGFVRLRGDEFRLLADRSDGAKLQRSYDVAGMADGTVVACVWDDVLRLDGDVWVSMHAPMRGLQRGYCACPAKDGTLWIGRGGRVGGVLKLVDGQWTILDQGEWHRSAAGSFCQSADGQLWMASDFGLFRVDGGDVNEISVLPARNFWHMLCDGTGGLWLGGLGSGLLHYRPDDKDPPRTFDAQVTFDKDGAALATWDGADYWNDTPPEQLSFRLWLDGKPVPPADEPPGATLTRKRSMTFADLEPGPHQLRVQAVDSLGNEDSMGDETRFEVDASTWASLPMLGAMVSLGGALAWLGMVLTHRRREREEAQRQQAELTERLSALTLRLLSSQEDERRNISRELHDDVGQLMTTICVDIQRAQKLVDSGRRDAALERALGAARRTLDRTHAISAMLRPPVLDDHGLPQAMLSALEEFGQRTGVDVQADLQLDGAVLPEAIAGHVYRILQEALTNVSRHARAASVDVRARADNGTIDLTVRDDGAGFLPDAVPIQRRFGLLGMRERAELLGGTFRLESSPGAGTAVHVSIPTGTRSEKEGLS